MESTTEEKGGPGRRVFVGNLAYKTSWQDLKDHMRQVGEVLYADIFKDFRNRSKGCGIVEFSKESEAQAAIKELNSTQLDGRKIFLREDDVEEGRRESKMVQEKREPGEKAPKEEEQLEKAEGGGRGTRGGRGGRGSRGAARVGRGGYTGPPTKKYQDYDKETPCR